MADAVASNRLRIFDTTLRDGEQAPGCAMTVTQKLRVARCLAGLRVDVIEAGFPAASPGDWSAVNEIADTVGATDAAPVICALARATSSDIAHAVSALAPARRRRLHVFISTSDLHIRHKLRCTRAEVLRRATEMVADAHAACDEVEFSAEDATRSDRGFLVEVFSAVVESGATTLNVPDTVGWSTPDDYLDLIAAVVREVAEPASRRLGTDVVVSTHCHNDLGLATANSLAGVRAGARQVECTLNGIGERAGNAALEEIVVALAVRHEAFGVGTGVRLEGIGESSRVVAECSGVHVPPNKAVVGVNAFAHESGIHQDGVLKHRRTYEIFDAQRVGLEGGRLVLGKHSGRHAFRRRLKELGHRLDAGAIEDAFARFKGLADRQKVVDAGDIDAIVEAVIAAQDAGACRAGFSVNSGNPLAPTPGLPA